MILLYHHISPDGNIPGDSVRFQNEGWRYTHSPASFEFHLLELQRRGYGFISLGQLVAEIHVKGTEPRNSAVITFDDGWIDNYVFAAPILKKLGIPATFFVTTAHLRTGKPDSNRMNSDQLRELIGNGLSIGTHTRTHPDLTRISETAARDEIAGSRADLEQAVGGPVDFIAYPGGAFNANVARITREAGYKAACSVLGPKTNDTTSLFWLYRDVLSPDLTTLADRYRLSTIARKVFSFRVSRRLNHRLAGSF